MDGYKEMENFSCVVDVTRSAPKSTYSSAHIFAFNFADTRLPRGTAILLYVDEGTCGDIPGSMSISPMWSSRTPATAVSVAVAGSLSVNASLTAWATVTASVADSAWTSTSMLALLEPAVLVLVLALVLALVLVELRVEADGCCVR